jgi:hypothetical protein
LIRKKLGKRRFVAPASRRRFLHIDEWEKTAGKMPAPQKSSMVATTLQEPLAE